MGDGLTKMSTRAILKGYKQVVLVDFERIGFDVLMFWLTC